MEKMWAGRFAKSLDSKADDFNSSIRFDFKMYKQDILGSMAHAEMLAKQGIIDSSDCTAILGGLSDILSDISSQFSVDCLPSILGSEHDVIFAHPLSMCQTMCLVCHTSHLSLSQ